MRRALAAILSVLVAVNIWAPNANAHPLGNFSVNRYSRIEVGRERVALRYVLDLAEIPTLQELRSFGVSEGRPEPAVHQRLLAAKTAELMGGAHLAMDGTPVQWRVEGAALDFIPGQADLDTMRVELTLVAPSADREGAKLEYRDTNYAGRAGWHEVVVLGIGDVAVAGSNVPARDQTDELRSYPADPTRAPLDVSSAGAVVQPGRAGTGDEASSPVERLATVPRLALDPTANLLAGLLKEGATATPLTVLLAMLVAVGLGALHALEPGHGKTMVGGYLVGARGTPRQAVLLGLTVTVTHTLGVYALGLVTLVAAQYVLPDRLYPILGMISGLLLVGIGLSLARSRLAAASVLPWRRSTRPLLEQDYVHVTSFEPSRAPDASEDDFWQAPGPRQMGSLPQQGPSQINLLAPEHQGHFSFASEHVHDDADPSAVVLNSPITHSHGGQEHTHHLPGVKGERVTAKRLLALGISGGILPCPSALVVLLAAVSFHNVALGLALVAAFSIGLATVLTGIGLAVVYGGRMVGRTSLAARVGTWPAMRAFPAFSALAITVAGLAIAAQAARAFS